MRRWITALIMVGIAGVGMLAAAPAAMAANRGCLVVDTDSNQSYPSLQAAVDAAAAGDSLFVKGTCAGFTVIDTSLTITGQSNGGTKTATLVGGLDIDSVTVTLNKLVITNAGMFGGGGIFTRLATLTLNDSTVATTPGTFGGGIENASGMVTLNDSRVTGGTSDQPDFAGGINNIDGTLILNGNSSVVGNTGTFGGIQNSGSGRATLIMNGSSTVTGNTAIDGGGIYNNGGRVTLNDSSSITGNTATGEFGGGIDNGGGTVTMNGSSSITGNSAGGNGVTGEGGGIFNQCGTLNGAVAPPAAGANVYNNIPDNIDTAPPCS